MPLTLRKLPAALPFIIGHRGISGKAPENTLASFRLALERPGIDGIELDVRLTKEEEVIVLHDRSLQRTTTGNGYARDYALHEIKEFDAGSWFNAKFIAERVPTLKEVLDLMGGRRWIDIELKSDFMHREPPGLLERKVLETVHSCGRTDSVFYTSFDHGMVRRIKEMDSDAATGVLYSLYRDFGRKPSHLASDAHASLFVCARHELTLRMLDDIRSHNLAIFVYTLNTVKAAEKMIELGVDGILSDNADDIVTLVRK
jgi:glycerophosphoryl diester phosphodiesterase